MKAAKEKPQPPLTADSSGEEETLVSLGVEKDYAIGLIRTCKAGGVSPGTMATLWMNMDSQLTKLGVLKYLPLNEAQVADLRKEAKLLNRHAHILSNLFREFESINSSKTKLKADRNIKITSKREEIARDCRIFTAPALSDTPSTTTFMV